MQSRIAVNPLASVSKVDQTIKTQVRRALTDEELIRLLESSPQYRRVPYFMSARTGLRYGELFELVWKDITFDGENSHVLVRASISKNKKETRIPLIQNWRNYSLVLGLRMQSLRIVCLKKGFPDVDLEEGSEGCRYPLY